MSVIIGINKKAGSVAQATPPILEKVENLENVEKTNEEVEIVNKVEEKPKSTRGRKKKSEQ